VKVKNRHVERVFTDRRDHHWERGSWRGIDDARLEMKEAAN
jgi:hypothetical protein